MTDPLFKPGKSLYLSACGCTEDMKLFSLFLPLSVLHPTSSTRETLGGQVKTILGLELSERGRNCLSLLFMTGRDGFLSFGFISESFHGYGAQFS